MTSELFLILLNALIITSLVLSLAFRFIGSHPFEKHLYVCLSIYVVLLALFRPLEITYDGEQYKSLAQSTCKVTECGFAQEINYDIGYFFLLSIAKVFFEDSQALLVISALALATKLLIIGRMTSYSILSLYFYFSVILLKHDMTELRVSIAIAFYLTALYLMSKGLTRPGIASYVASALSHFQAIIAPIVHFASVLTRGRYRFAVLLVLLSQIAIIFDLVLSDFLLNKFSNTDVWRLYRQQNLDENLAEIRITNVLIISLFAAVSMSLKQVNYKNKFFDLCFGSVFVGYMLYWVFFGIPTIPDRVLQFFWVPLAVLVSLGRYHLPTFILSILVGAGFYFLYTWHDPIIFF